MTYVIEKSLRVYDNESGVFLEVSNNPDYPETGIIVTTVNNKENEAWYGKIRLTLNSKEQAVKLAQAILEMSETIK